MSSLPQILVRACALAAVGVVLAGCGQKGALYLAAPRNSQAASAPTARPTPSTDNLSPLSPPAE